MTRGRRRDPTLEPTRQLQTSRAFRERRAAHLKSLEEQVENQAEEIKRLKARLGEAVDGDEDGEGGEEEAAAALAGQPNGETTTTTGGHRRGTLSFSTTASSSRSSMEHMSPEHGGKRRLTEAYYGGGGGASGSSSSGDRRRPATSSGVSGSSTPQPCHNCETVRQQAHQLMLMLSDVENRMGTMRAAGVTLAQTLHHQQQQHQQQQQQSQPHQPQWHSPAMPSRQQAISGPPPYSSGGGGGGGSSSGGHAPTHRALYSIPVAASPPLDPPQLSLPSLPTAIASTSTSLPMNTPSVLAAGGMPRTPAEEKCCLGIFKCDDAGRIIV